MERKRLRREQFRRIVTDEVIHVQCANMVLKNKGFLSILIGDEMIMPGDEVLFGPDVPLYGVDYVDTLDIRFSDPEATEDNRVILQQYFFEY